MKSTKDHKNNLDFKLDLYPPDSQQDLFPEWTDKQLKILAKILTANFYHGVYFGVEKEVPRHHHSVMKLILKTGGPEELVDDLDEGLDLYLKESSTKKEAAITDFNDGLLQLREAFQEQNGKQKTREEKK